MKFCTLIFICLTLFSTLYSFESKTYDFTFDALDDWIFTELEADKVLQFVHPEAIATFNVSAYRLKHDVTANALQQRRMGTLYDGWINLFERPANKKELLSANVLDAYRAVYTKDYMDETFDKKTILVAEFYYVYEGFAYILNLETEKSHFDKVQDDLKLALNGFWVGNKEETIVENQNENFQFWNMVGKNAQNWGCNSSDKFDFGSETVLSDQFLLSGTLDPDFLQISDGERLFFVLSQTLYCLDLIKGDVLWSFEVKGIKPNSLAYFNGLLAYFRQGVQSVEVVLAENGNVLHQHQVEGEISSLISAEGSLHFLSKQGLHSLNWFTGQQEIFIPFEKVNLEIYPVLGHDHIIVYDEGGAALSSFDFDGDLQWQYSLSGFLVSKPIIQGQEIFIFEQVESENGFVLVLSILDLKSGRQLWQKNSKLSANLLKKQPFVHNKMLYYLAENESLNVVRFFAFNTLTRNWEWQAVMPSDSTFSSSLVTPKALAFSNLNSDSLLCFDRLTGSSFSIFSKGVPELYSKKPKYEKLGLITDRIYIFQEYAEGVVLRIFVNK